MSTELHCVTHLKKRVAATLEVSDVGSFRDLNAVDVAVASVASVVQNAVDVSVAFRGHPWFNCS